MIKKALYVRLDAKPVSNPSSRSSSQALCRWWKRNPKRKPGSQSRWGPRHSAFLMYSRTMPAATPISQEKSQMH